MPLENTEIITKSVESGSTFLSVSIRAWLAILVIGTGCTMALLELNIEEPMYSLILMVAGLYFGQKSANGK